MLGSNVSSTALGKLFKLTKTQFPHLWNGDTNGIQLIGLLRGLSEMMI